MKYFILHRQTDRQTDRHNDLIIEKEGRLKFKTVKWQTQSDRNLKELENVVLEADGQN